MASLRAQWLISVRSWPTSLHPRGWEEALTPPLTKANLLREVGVGTLCPGIPGSPRASDAKLFSDGGLRFS